MPGNLAGMIRLVTDRNIPEWFPSWPVFGDDIYLNLGAGDKEISGTVALDLPEWDADKDPIPYMDGSVRGIYAIHFLEHVKDPIAVLRECQRVLVPGGILNVGVPYYTSQGAYHDLDHKSFWTEETWRNLFSNPYYAKNHEGWKFEIGLNLIVGIVERNTMLITQLIKRTE